MRFWLSLFLLFVSSAAAFAQSDNPDTLRSEKLDSLRYEEARTESFLDNVRDNEADANEKLANLEKSLANEKVKIEPIAPRDGIAKRLKVKQAEERIGWIEADIKTAKDYIARMQKHQRESGAELVELRAQIAAEEESLAAAKAAEEKRIADEKAAAEAHRLEMQTTWYRVKWVMLALPDIIVAAAAYITLGHYVVAILLAVLFHRATALRLSFGLTAVIFLALWKFMNYDPLGPITAWRMSYRFLVTGIDIAFFQFNNGARDIGPAGATALGAGSLLLFAGIYIFVWFGIGTEGRAAEKQYVRERLRQARWWLPRPWLWPEGLVAATGAPFRAMRERREQRRIEAEEQAFYHPAAYSSGAGGMTVNVRAPVTVSEWMRRVYWTLALLMLLIPAGFILARTGTLISLAAALVPLEWQDEVIGFLQYMQEMVRKGSPQ